jgi:hypothetical protein
MDDLQGMGLFTFKHHKKKKKKEHKWMSVFSYIH